jgi:hypothetical protein
MAALAVFFPVISRLFPSLSLGTVRRRRPIESPSKVWVNLRSGFYYCRDSSVYGKLTPGTFMTQRQALQAGYSPAGQKHCP